LNQIAVAGDMVVSVEAIHQLKGGDIIAIRIGTEEEVGLMARLS